MRHPVRLLVAAAAVLGLPAVASAQVKVRVPGQLDPATANALGGRAPWNQPWEYDSGGNNDRRPELPYYQQNRAQQSGGPARNLIPYDGLTFAPH